MELESEFLRTDLKLTGWKICSIELKENKLFIGLQSKSKIFSNLTFEGIIGLKDYGAFGKVLKKLSFKDMGSYKVFSFLNKGNKTVFICKCMEGKQTVF